MDRVGFDPPAPRGPVKLARGARHWPVLAALAGTLLIWSLLTPIHGRAASPQSRALRDKGYELAYNLDYAEALAVMRQAVAETPNDVSVQRGLASVAWLDILFRRGSVLVDNYLGQVTKPTVELAKPSAELDALFHESADRALALAEARLRTNPNDVSAHYEVGAVVGLIASYTATVEGSVFGAFRAARRAFNEHEEVLGLDSRRKDAGLVLGTYRYIVSTQSMPVRWIAYIAGFGGGRERGIRMIEEAAVYNSDVQSEARFALVLLYNREGRYLDALKVIRELQSLYPRNRLLWLEHGATAIRAGRPGETEAALTEGLARLETDHRPRLFGEEALWRYKRGAARVLLEKRGEAEQDLRAALTGEGRDWVRGRAHAELGKLADLAGDGPRARVEYRTAVSVGEKDGDPTGVSAARQLLATGYKGRNR
jgi:tetratricopeptide (TPR) repeat protein